MGTISLLPLDLPVTLKIQKRGNFYLGKSTNPDLVRHTPVFPERERQLLTSFPGLRYSSCLLKIQFSSVAQLCLTVQPQEQQHTRPPCPTAKLTEFTQTPVQ